MYDVMIIQTHSDDQLICGTRIHERLAGLALSVVVSPLVIALGRFYVDGATHVLAPFLFACVVFLFGLYVFLSSRRATFTAHTRTATIRVTVLGLFRWQQEIEFSQIAVRRRHDWYLPRWLWPLVLVNLSRTRPRGSAIGYATGRVHAEMLAQAIAKFTDTTPVDFAGRPLDLSISRREPDGSASGL